MTMGVNHLSHFLLTNLLMDLLIQSKSRVINVSSGAHRAADWDIDQINWSLPYNPMKVYANSKLANIYFTRQLHNRFHEKGITAYALHPGVVRTNFAADVTGGYRLLLYAVKPFMISSKQGAQTQLFLTLEEDVSRYSGQFLEKKKLGRLAQIGRDDEAATELWEKSEELVKNFL